MFPPLDAERLPARTLPTRSALPTERMGAVLEVIICSGFPTQLLLIAVLRGFGMPIKAADGALNPQFVFTVSLLDAVLVVGLVLLFLRAHHESAREVLLGRVRALREVLVGIGLIPLTFFIVALIMALVRTYLPQLHNVEINPFGDMLKTRNDALIFAAVVMIAGGVREEVQRGFILHRFGQYLGGGLFGVLFWSVFFGLGHFEQGYDAMIATATLGAFWGFIYLRRRSVIAPVVSHAGFNLAQILTHLAR